MQTVAPALDAKAPVGQLEQPEAPAVEYLPAAHNTTADRPVDGQYEPAGHDAQPVDPAPGAYVPERQLVQAVVATAAV